MVRHTFNFEGSKIVHMNRKVDSNKLQDKSNLSSQEIACTYPIESSEPVNFTIFHIKNNCLYKSHKKRTVSIKESYNKDMVNVSKKHVELHASNRNCRT